MDREPRAVNIAVAGNTYIPCLLALRAKGYALRQEYLKLSGPDGGYQSWYYAERGHARFIADNPIELLGLVAMWEARGDDWMLKPGEAAIDDELHAAAKTFDRDGNEIDD